jgi:hypothetical protein
MGHTMRLEDQKLLREVIWRRQPLLIPIIDAMGEAPLKEEDREMIRNVLADEFIETGLSGDDEPNERGIRLDNIIGLLMYY